MRLVVPSDSMLCMSRGRSLSVAYLRGSFGVGNADSGSPSGKKSFVWFLFGLLSLNNIVLSSFILKPGLRRVFGEIAFLTNVFLKSGRSTSSYVCMKSLRRGL